MKARLDAAVEKLDEIQLRILTQYAEGLVEENELRAKLPKELSLSWAGCLKGEFQDGMDAQKAAIEEWRDSISRKMNRIAREARSVSLSSPQRTGSNANIRLAAESDLVAINDIYNYYVPRSTCTYQEEPESMEHRQRWLAQHTDRHPAIVAVIGDRVVGWGSLSPFHSRCAYRHTVENSVYIHPDHHRRGIGSMILDDLIVRARRLGHHAIIAGIDSEQAASIALHRRFGFVQVGHLPEVGRKFDRWLDVVYMQLTLRG